MRGGIAVRSAQLAILALCVAAAVLIFLVALDTTPIADDYGDLPGIEHSGVFQYLHSYWVGATDRYSNAVFMVVLVKLFGAAAIHVATPLLIALLVWFCVSAARSVGTSAQRKLDAFVVGCLAAITIAVSTPSIFDTLGWFNAVAIYLAGIVAAAGTAAWMAHLTVRTRPVTSREEIACFLVGVVTAGFTELVGIVITFGSLLAIANLRDVSTPGPRRRSLEIAYGVLAAGAAAGVIVILMGPGSRGRVHIQRGGFDLSLIETSMRVNLAWAKTNLGWRTFLSIAAGLALLHLKEAPRNQRAQRWLFVWAFCVCCLPILVVGASGGYAGNITPPLRAISIATASITVGEAMIAYVVAAAIVSAKPQSNSIIIPTAAVALAVGLIGFASTAIPVIRAELLRRTAVAARAASIRRQLLQHPRSVSVMPAPLIVVDSNAYDFLFDHKRQLNYVFSGTRQYYGIPSGVVIHVIARQPRHYCLANASIPSYGVESCAQLESDRRAHALR